jgi:hypothetical protein
MRWEMNKANHKSTQPNRRGLVALTPREKVGCAVHAPALISAAVAYLFRSAN